MKLSIITTAFQRAELIRYQFLSLMVQTINFPFEILVINDGLPDETKQVCNEFKDNLPIRYLWTGQRNIKELTWRSPVYSINIGIKQAQGENIIITCAEIFLIDDLINTMIELLNQNSKYIIITNGKDDRKGDFLNFIKNPTLNPYTNLEFEYSKIEHKLSTEFPFFMGLNRKEIINIGGYDEDFGLNYCFDDNEFVQRLQNNNFIYKKLNERIVHLYHPRLEYQTEEVKRKWQINKELYEQKKNQLIANQNKEWGKINE